MNIYSSGNAIVDAVGQINLVGNVVPETWYAAICHKNGKPNMNAIMILSDIVYWYRPKENRNEFDGSVSFEKRFTDDEFLQRSYKQLSLKFGISERQAKDAVVFLEKETGIIRRHFKQVKTGYSILSNVMFIELLPDRLHEITFPSGRGVTIERHTPVVETIQTPRYNDTPPSIERHTYTKTITENNNIDYDQSIYPDGKTELVPVESMSRDELTYENFKSEASILPQDKAKARAEEELKALISYDVMKNDKHYKKDLVDAMLDYMSDILAARAVFKLGNTVYSTAVMGNAFYRLNGTVIQYVADKFSEVSKEQKIKNKRSYLLRMLLTAPSDMETDVQAAVNYDMAHWNGGEA